jgi:23S rRNA (cytosine1962-C5)-methyltransferase
VPRITLKPGRERPVRGGHPWVFSGAIADGLAGLTPGAVVKLMAADGRFVAVGYANPRTPIAVRILSLDDEAIDGAFVAKRIDHAMALRAATLPEGLLAYRVLNGEGDRLPGIVVDRYGDFLVCQLLTAGAVALAPLLVAALAERFAPRGIYERSEGGVRAEEGVAGRRGVLHGEEPPARIEIDETGCRFLVDVLHGQKTGFFLDQRDTRQRIRSLAAGRRVLNAFAYTGGIGIAAGLGGAREVVSVDTSGPALGLAQAAWALNGLPPEGGRFVEADVFEFLRAEREPFDLVVLDPPPFVRRRRDLDPGLRGYKDVNLQGLRRLAPDGWFVTASCSQHVARDVFRDVVAHAASDAGRVLSVVAETGHPPDHPTLVAHSEAQYLKVLWCRA